MFIILIGDSMKEIIEIQDYMQDQSTEQCREIYLRHGANDNVYGSKVADMKLSIKKYRKNHDVGVKLHQTHQEESMYAAHFIIDPTKLDKTFFYNELEHTSWYMISEYSFANLVSRSNYAIELIKEFIKDKRDFVKACGYSALAGYCMLTDDSLLDYELIDNVLLYIKDNIHTESNRTRYALNNLLIAIGGSVKDKYQECYLIGEHIGKVKVDLGKTSCKVPYTPDYLEKMQLKGKIGEKRKKKTC